MKARIHFSWPDGTDDAIDLEGENAAEIQETAERELAKRRGSNPWSEVLEE